MLKMTTRRVSSGSAVTELVMSLNGTGWCEMKETARWGEVTNIDLHVFYFFAFISCFIFKRFKQHDVMTKCLNVLMLNLN